ncbi:MAG: pyridoxal phosphate-dependent class II aminotransferase [Verrucomicrobia bacterium]|nr:pyridoxal phosphate-dependent class II aminotransferase [Verrucomicrobiota bacterium]MCG2681569.1 pyridoxal phosphate-dependent class II aminotransferase [Kiritimatiellia bacterium]MBU4248123.1 pyridoxal phosphate-dependent class II aminotransferase [Verrucomicrobiota bacterium]MBU4290651.1 pyridoxal phosphate-dependent class II aminotransferase [Verrucomicrobiota bacterium]MBU4430013.1 pyridoxal phosphate-dependent class II aminotransferase [Verrucomicrobiota bacterium]
MFTGHGGTGAAEARALGRPVLDVSASIAPFSPPEAARLAYQRAAADLDRYPPIDGFPLRQSLADSQGLDIDNVLAGGGTTEFIYLIPRTLRPGRVLGFVPTYRDYAEAARLAGCAFVPLLTVWEQRFARDLAKLDAAARAQDLVFLCNPNNPTGDILAPDVIRGFCDRRPDVTVVVDEAYVEFAGIDRSCLDSTMPRNLLVLRSPTKFYAVPGIRLGYCLGRRDLIAALLDAKEPWTVSAPALAVGLALLNYSDYEARVRDVLGREKPALECMLAAIPGLSVCPGAANFLLCRIQADAPPAADLRAACLKQGLLIRDASNFEGLDSRYFRVAVRTGEENIRMARIIRDVLTGPRDSKIACSI